MTMTMSHTPSGCKGEVVVDGDKDYIYEANLLGAHSMVHVLLCVCATMEEEEEYHQA